MKWNQFSEIEILGKYSSMKIEKKEENLYPF